MGNSHGYGVYDSDDCDNGGYFSEDECYDYNPYVEVDYGFAGRYSRRAEKSAAATRREGEAKSKFDYLRAQMELATHDNVMTTIGLSVQPRASNRSPLRSLPPDVMRKVLGYAGIDKPKGTTIVKRAARARDASGGAIAPYDGFFEATKSPRSAKVGEEEIMLNLIDMSLFQAGSKIVFPLTKPNLHLTGPCYRDLRKHVKRYPQWDVKRTAATPEQKRAYKETRQGKVYFINAVYSVPGKLQKRKGKKAQPSTRGGAASNGAAGKRKRGTVEAEMASIAAGVAKAPPEQMAANKKPTTSSKGTAATKAKTAVAPPAASLTGGRCAPATQTGRVAPPPTNPQTPKCVSIEITKPTKDTRLGIGVSQQQGTSKAKVTLIHPDSVFFGTHLRVGMILETINGRKYGSFDECLALMKTASGRVVFVASLPPAPVGAARPGSNVAAAKDRKAAVVAAPSDGGAAVVPASIPAGKFAAVAVSSPSSDSGETAVVESEQTVTIVINKPTKETKLGLGIGRLAKDVVVTTIHPHSIFQDTKLSTMMRIVMVNGASYATFQEGVDLLANAEGVVTVVATALPAPAGRAHESPPIKAKQG